jgi:2,5-diamino-6-(ribosylamino)-4(3H)-pyrimidinone 5'-phosphate reductase
MPRPYVVINVAATVDGKIDTRDRRGAAISSDADRDRVSLLRASVDGVMVGGRTLHQEDPRLTVRTPALVADRVSRGLPPHPARIAVASRFSLSADSRFVSGTPARVIVFVPRGAGFVLPGVEVYELGEQRVDLVRALDVLGECGLQRVLVEGGGSLNFELLRLGLVDELQLYLAPLVFGGSSAPTLADGEGLPREAAVQLEPPTIEKSDDGGLVLRYMVKRS